MVGPCSAGKTTLINGLEEKGYFARHIAQEHSNVSDMWKRLANPKVLIYLDVSYHISMQRRNLNMSQAEFIEQCNRLDHAQRHADLYIQTDDLSPFEVLQRVVTFLAQKPPISP